MGVVRRSPQPGGLGPGEAGRGAAGEARILMLWGLLLPRVAGGILKLIDIVAVYGSL